jgi:diguanylate cyclase
VSDTASFVEPDFPANEEDRLEELYSLNLLDDSVYTRFDQYTELISDIFGFPVVLVTLIDRRRQWFKSAFGWEIRECPRAVSFCGHTINQQGVMVVPDALEDSRFAGNPLVTNPPHIRFYAGTVVHGPAGCPLGSLCVIDHIPRKFDDRQCRHLRRFADLVEGDIRHTHDLTQLRTSLNRA